MLDHHRPDTLLHSRFRPANRAERLKENLAVPSGTVSRADCCSPGIFQKNMKYVFGIDWTAHGAECAPLVPAWCFCFAAPKAATCRIWDGRRISTPLFLSLKIQKTKGRTGRSRLSLSLSLMLLSATRPEVANLAYFVRTLSMPSKGMDKMTRSRGDSETRGTLKGPPVTRQRSRQAECF